MIQNLADNLQDAVRRRYRATPLPAFFAWWGGELAPLVPATLRRRWMPPKPQLWIVPAETGGGDLRILRVGDSPAVADVFGAGEDLDLLRDRWRDLQAGFEDGRPEVRLCLHEDDVLALPIELPAAIESNLAQALKFQIDQVSPFSPDQVYFDHRVAAHDHEHGRLQVELRMVPRETVDGLLERLRAVGVVIHRVDTLRPGDEAEPEGFNLLPDERRPHYVHARARFNLVLAGLLVLLAGLIMAQSLILRERTVNRLTEDADRLRTEARQVMALQQRLEESLLAANFLAEKRAAQPPAIELLAETTRLLPDDIWLQRFQLQGQEMTVQGLTNGSQRVINLLNESELLRDTEIRGNITMDPRSGKERFTTTSQVVRADGPDAAQVEDEGGA
ncbi:PilN domain-containing protein [Wenzhouxiangella sp. XN79A]|uniref:PilN domain-containing protein n=1 Tax=Wenzhouxiangella sp. XN79A TaxID=2724193 RepID=UPI00144ACCD5|nr:PilN domain-containing protein [Wenzhouxiangella sp. XN79A]NKI35076.1 PilN domain-containing protein [Wenzhouxiangella sp. XN79A]